MSSNVVFRSGTRVARTCRVCYVPSPNSFSLFKPNRICGQITTLARVLSYCVSVDVLEEEDFMPDHICGSCATNLEQVMEFKQKARNIDQFLRERHEKRCASLPINGVKLNEQHAAELNNDLEIVEEEQEESNVLVGCDIIEEMPEDDMHMASHIPEDLYEVVEVQEQQQREEEKEEEVEELAQEDTSEEEQQPAATAARTRRPKPISDLLQCKICNKQLSTSNSFKYHMQLHGDAKPFECTICGESFKTRNAFDGHITTHDPNNPNTCNICGKFYRQASSLRTHMLAHKGVKPYQCTLCGKRLTQKSGYKKHMLTHTGEKPHTCDICHRSFRYSSNLIAHKRCHSQEKPHECQVCHKRSFANSSDLTRHMLVHSNERPFKCLDCGKTFKRQISLNVHMKSKKTAAMEESSLEYDEEN
ncbi:GL19920 [Drosophila persimilis]|uniref:GL19920 n=1 Tax=Drosophila persimilis TaxID=7234 RepID=B4GYG8_DROPE|nr:zinc finger protein 771 [Drosophila persimilis]EDW27824.1 GL19920 [Drosophila persimilis]